MEVWQWLVVLVFVCVLLWLLVQYLRQRAASDFQNTPLKGIGGWLALLALLLCLGFIRGVVEFVQGMPDYFSGFENRAAHGPLIIVGLISIASIAVHFWGIVALFQKKKLFRTVFATVWLIALLAPLSLLSMLIVPGVTVEMILPAADIGRLIGVLVAMGLWYWYISVSVRAKNTLVN